MLDESLKNAKNTTVGLKQTRRALEKGNVGSIYIAKDADSRIISPIIEMCKINNVKIREVQSMSELGKACGIEVGAAVVAVLSA